MGFATQVGYVINVGPVFVIPSGSESKQMILLCQVENVEGKTQWTTRTREPAYVSVLNASGGNQFPYAQNAVTIEGYDNDQLVSLLETDTYRLPNFGAHNYAGSYQNVGSDWLTVSFRAPNLIRNKLEWDANNGSAGTPGGTKPAGVPSPAPDPGGGSTNWYLYAGIAVIVLLVIILITSSRRRSR